jgi:hypothetical protein
LGIIKENKIVITRKESHIDLENIIEEFKNPRGV